MRKPNISPALLVAACAGLLTACSAVSVVDTAVGITGSVAGAAVDVTTGIVGGAVDLVTEEDDQGSD